MRAVGDRLALKVGRTTCCIYAAIVAFAVLCQAPATIVGLHEDTMLHWEGGLRILAGQVPFRDFYMPWGPVTEYVAAGALLLAAGSVGWGMVLLGSVANAAAAVFVASIVRRGTQDNDLTLGSGLFTGAWFLPHIGGWYVDHAAYLIILGASVFYLGGRRSSNVTFAVMGVCVAAAFWTKQTTGVLAASALAAALFSREGWGLLRSRRLLIAGICCLVTNIAVVACLLIWCDFGRFIEAFYRLPMEYAQSQPDKRLVVQLLNAAMPFKINIVSAIAQGHLGAVSFYPMVILVYAAYVVFIVRRARWVGNPELRFSVVYLLGSSLLCSPMVGRDFPHLVWGLGGVFALVCGLALERVRPVPRRVWIYVGLGVFVGISWLHLYHGARKGDSSPIGYPRSASLQPIRLSEDVAPDVSVRALVEVAEWLLQKGAQDRQIAVYDDNAKIVPLLLGKAPHNDLLYYDHLVTVGLGATEKNLIQTREKAALERASVDFVVSTLRASHRRFREVHPEPPGYERLSDLGGYLHSKYNTPITFGGIEVYTRKGGQ